MNMIKKYIAALLPFFALTSAHAANLPSDMIFEGHPIDSLCFNTENNTQTIDLRQCGAKYEKYLNKGQNTYLTNQGFIGYDWQDSSIPSASEGYSYYQFFPAKDKQYWVYAINNGGGTGVFTTIYLAQRKDTNTFTIKNITGSGDRCNGGIEDVAEKNHSLTFSVNLTSYDLVASADKKLPAIKAYDDLAACAVCCVAKAFYTVNDANSGPQFTYVTLDKTTNADLPDQGKYAACFNKLLTSYIDKKQTVFNQEKINAFADQFNRMCVH